VVRRCQRDRLEDRPRVVRQAGLDVEVRFRQVPGELVLGHRLGFEQFLFGGRSGGRIQLQLQLAVARAGEGLGLERLVLEHHLVLPVFPTKLQPLRPAIWAPLRPAIWAPLRPAIWAPLRPAIWAPLRPAIWAPLRPAIWAPLRPAT